MKRVALAFLALVGLSWTGWTFIDGFSPSSIRGSSLEAPALPVSEEIAARLHQPFHYLGRGRQCFAFESEDGKYVLKFFDQKYFQMPWYAVFRLSQEKAKRALRRYFYEHSYQIAWQEFGDEILYLHQGVSQGLPTIEVRSRVGFWHRIDLNEVPFVLQKRGIPFYEGLSQVYRSEGMDGLRREMDTFLALIAARIRKGVADADADVEHNWGYVEGHIFHLDPGRLYYDETLSLPSRREKEWQTATCRFQKWLKAHHPELLEYFEKSLEESLKN